MEDAQPTTLPNCTQSTQSKKQKPHSRAGKKVSDYPVLFANWDYEKNDKPPLKVSATDKKKYDFICKEHGPYQTRPVIATRGNLSGCPDCSSKHRSKIQKEIKSRNSILFGDGCPEGALHWHPLNPDLPNDHALFANEERLFYCRDCGKPILKYLSKYGTGRCKTCASKIGGKKFSKNAAKNGNSLPELHPDLANEVYAKDKTFLNDIAPYANMTLQWQCPNPKCRHIYPARVADRTSGTGCPECCGGQTSKRELYLYAEIKSVYPTSLHRHKIEGVEADIFIPELKLVLEIDGNWHHKKTDKDVQKDKHFQSMNLTILRIRDSRLPSISSSFMAYHDKEELQALTNKLMQSLSKHYEQFASYSGQQTNKSLYEELYTKYFRYGGEPVEHNLTETHPELCKEWNYEKNILGPWAYTAGCHDKVWWVCLSNPEHRSYEAQIKNRSGGYRENARGTGCPACYKESHKKTT